MKNYRSKIFSSYTGKISAMSPTFVTNIVVSTRVRSLSLQVGFSFKRFSSCFELWCVVSEQLSGRRARQVRKLISENDALP